MVMAMAMRLNSGTVEEKVRDEWILSKSSTE